MPRGQGRIASNAEIVSGRRNRSHLRRSLDERNRRFSSEERQISTLLLGNTEQRCLIFTLVSPELDDYCKLATFLQSLKVPDQRNHLPSAVTYESQPALTFLVNLQKPESTCIPNSSSVCSSSNMSIMRPSCNRNKRSKSLKDLSNNFAPRCMTVDTSSGSPSSDLVSDISKVEKPIKRSSKKKGKKKGKHYKRSSSKKDPSQLNAHYEGDSYSAPLIETSMAIPPACLNDQISDNLSDNASSPPTFLVDDITIEKDAGDNNHHTDSSATMMSCVSFNDDREESEAVVCSSQGFAHEKHTDSSTGELKSTSSNESVVSAVSVNIKSGSLKESITCNGNSSSTYVDLYDDDGGDATLGSFQNIRKISVSENCSKDVERRLSINDDGGGDISVEKDSNFRSCDPSFERSINSFDMSNGVSYNYDYRESFVYVHSSTERVQCSSEASSTNDFQPVKSGKRARAARKMMTQTGKDNVCAVWQKVEKTNTRHCINEANNVCAVSRKAETPSKASGVRVRLNSSAGLDRNVKTSKRLYPSENNVKRHIVSKEVNNYSRKGSFNGNVNIARPSKIHFQQKEGMKILSPVNQDEHCRSGLRSPCIKSAERHIQEAMPPRNTCSVDSQMTSSVACNQIDLPSSTLDSLGQIHKTDIEGRTDNSDFWGYEKTHNDFYLMDDIDQDKNAECSLVEYKEADDNSVPELRKWVPVGKKDAIVSHIGHAENVINSVTDKSVSYMLDNRNVEVSSDVQFYVPLIGSEMQCSSRSGDDADCSSSETDILSDKLMSCSGTDVEFSVPNGSKFQLTHGVNDRQFSKFETDIEKIIHSVNDAYNLQTAAGVDLMAESPLAELETFMHAASPVISQRHLNRVFTACSTEQRTGSCMSVHQLHKISLASLWQWYEEPGCYGLEVRSEDNHKSKRLHDGSVEFRAYFVPYLSAVQLFGRSDSTCASSCVEVTVSSEIDEASRSSSNLGSLPILSVLLPRAHEEVNACFLESTLPALHEFCNESVKGTDLNDNELIFEYFEHAQPPQRRPLFEKIKELVNCDRSSNGNMYGDSSKLECLSLHDLSPASWFAVAWYPIYRIPQGNFRAAFLTYHSLGHFIHQNASSNIGCDSTRVVCPVVGLQSYNAKKECWFQPRDMKYIKVEKEEASISSPSKFLEERLRTLDQTASVMATATVRKGNERSVNNHPDYNYFFSRW